MSPRPGQGDLLCFYCLGSLPGASGRHWAGSSGQGRAAGTNNAPSVPVPELAGVRCPALCTGGFQPGSTSLGFLRGGAACRPRWSCSNPSPKVTGILSVGSEFSDPNALKSQQLLAASHPATPDSVPSTPAILPESASPGPFLRTSRSFPSFGNFSPAAHTVPFLGPIPAGLGGVGGVGGVCCFLGHHRGSWKLGDVGQDCGGRVEHTTSPGTDFTGCTLLCPPSQNCSDLLETGAEVHGVALVMGQSRRCRPSPAIGVGRVAVSSEP